MNLGTQTGCDDGGREVAFRTDLLTAAAPVWSSAWSNSCKLKSELAVVVLLFDCCCIIAAAELALLLWLRLRHGGGLGGLLPLLPPLPLAMEEEEYGTGGGCPVADNINGVVDVNGRWAMGAGGGGVASRTPLKGKN